MFYLHLLIGTILIGVTVFIHAICLDFIFKHIEPLNNFVNKAVPFFKRATFLAFVVLGVMIAHTIEIWIWALLYYISGAVPDFESALYFSTSSFTTVGYGDVVLDKSWRLLGGIESANGFILFGWSTAFVFEIMYLLYDKEKPPMRGDKK